MARLLLIRHGQSVWNAESRWQGWADPPLSELGESQAVALAAELEAFGFRGIVSSDLRRARRTASIIAERLRVDVDVDPALRERDVGAWSGLTTSEIERRWPSELVAWRSGRLSGPPGGERDDAMSTRALRALLPLLGRPESPLLVITHGGLIRLVERTLGLDPDTTPNLSGRWVHGSGAGTSVRRTSGGLGSDGLGSADLMAGEPFVPDLDESGELVARLRLDPEPTIGPGR